MSSNNSIWIPLSVLIYPSSLYLLPLVLPLIEPIAQVQQLCRVLVAVPGSLLQSNSPPALLIGGEGGPASQGTIQQTAQVILGCSHALLRGRLQ